VFGDVLAGAGAAIRAAAQTKDNPADLINVALEELVRQSCELPGYTTLDAMTATIRTEVNQVVGAVHSAGEKRDHTSWILRQGGILRRRIPQSQ
jgi:hypothetical protein